MKVRYNVGQDFVINPNDMGASPASLDGRLVGQTPENVPAIKPGYFVINGKFVWLSKVACDAMLIEKQRVYVRAKKAAFQGQESYHNLRVQGQ